MIITKNREAFILTHLGLGDNITAIGMVRYLKTLYDVVTVVCKTRNKTNVEEFYKDDSNIKIYSVNDDNEISIKFGFSPEKFLEINKNMDIYLCGIHKFKDSIIYDIPFSFYHDINLDHSIFWEYFKISKNALSETLYNLIKNMDYIFIHNNSSDKKEIFSVEYLENKFKIHKDKTFIINPNQNIYSKGDYFYNLAEKFLEHTLTSYIDTIINAKYLVLTDSSFYCLAMNLDIKTSNCYLVPRDVNSNYDYIYSDKYIFNSQNVNRKIFYKLNI